MARPRGAARSRRHAPPLDKPGRSGLLALRRFHDGLQTSALVRLLVRTEKEEIMPRPHPHDIPKRNRIWKPEISKCDFFFFAEHGGKWAASAFPTTDTRHRPPQRNSLIRLIRCYAVRVQHHLSLSRLRGRTKKIGHPNGAPDSSLQINYIVDDLVPQSFANTLMV